MNAGFHDGANPCIRLLVTMWDEIQELLLTGQSASDRHDISARVFKQKLKYLMDYIVKHQVFGETRCWMYSAEWQKRIATCIHFDLVG